MAVFKSDIILDRQVLCFQILLCLTYSEPIDLLFDLKAIARQIRWLEGKPTLQVKCRQNTRWSVVYRVDCSCEGWRLSRTCLFSLFPCKIL